MDGLIFDDGDCELKTIPVRFRGRDFTLREATADAGAQFRNSLLKSTKMTDGKVTGLDGLADAEVLLVSLCLLEGSDMRVVPKGEIKTWPSRIVKKLYDKAREISDLDEAETVEEVDRRIEALTKQREKLLAGGTEAKNDPSAATDTSA